MTVLIVLTLLYAFILVIALVAGLIAILYFLNGARSSLNQIASGLKEADRNVEPLRDCLTALNDRLNQVLTDLQKAARKLTPAQVPPEERQLGTRG
jgi:uncharacterized protein YoxC